MKFTSERPLCQKLEILPMKGPFLGKSVKPCELLKGDNKWPRRIVAWSLGGLRNHRIVRWEEVKEIPAIKKGPG
jgi:hypothetical protein